MFFYSFLQITRIPGILVLIFLTLQYVNVKNIVEVVVLGIKIFYHKIGLFTSLALTKRKFRATMPRSEILFPLTTTVSATARNVPFQEDPMNRIVRFIFIVVMLVFASLGT